MKKLSNKWLLPAVLLTVGIASAGLIASRQTEFSGKDNPGENLVARAPQIGEKEEENGERIDQRRDWFLQQRLYGSTEIPADGRQRAKEVADAVAPALARKNLAAFWTAVGPQPLESAFPNNYGDASGRINGITVSPADPNIVLLASATGGIWRSTNAMADPLGVTPPTFVPVSDNQVDIAVGSIAFAPSNPQIVYAGMGDHDSQYLGTS